VAEEKKNSLIDSELRLSAAIRYFAGGRPDDICLVHGISHTEVFNSVWKVVDAVINCESLHIGYPTDCNKQKEIAKGFKAKSYAGFGACVGAIDGMLIWTEKPHARDCGNSEVGARKFFCGRKKKHGLNLQAVCDSNRKFLDISILHPGTTADFLCFTTSSIGHKLDNHPSFLAPGYCLFGDSPCVNTSYMATPFKGARSGPKDDYNFYHSQVRINIECAFGMFSTGGVY